MRSKADMSQLNLLQGTSGKQKKLKIKKRICSEVSVNSLENPWSQSWRRKGRLRWEGFAEKEGFNPGMKEWGGNGILKTISTNVSSTTTVQNSTVMVRCLEYSPLGRRNKNYWLGHQASWLFRPAPLFLTTLSKHIIATRKHTHTPV